MLKFLLSFISLTLLIYAGSISIPAAGSKLPPIGKFFSPATGFWNNGNNKLSTSINITSLSADANVVIDDRGVPHIFASSYIDAASIQGYLHAKDRLFQMDASSRFTAGRLSELFGSRMFSIDKLMRRRGLPYAAENAIKGWQKNPEFLRIVDAYTSGVNAYIAELNPADYPIEYKLLNIEKIEPWSNYKTACINKGMTYDLCFRNKDDLATKSLELLGPELYNFLFPARNKKEDPVIPPGTPWNTVDNNDIGGIDYLNIQFPDKIIKHHQAHLPFEGIGSNNWAVSGAKTKSGSPILCNDPHLKLRLPSVWYEVQIHTDDVNVYGVSLPGVPGVIIGFNEHVAWGVTNVSIDVLDWYDIKWDNQSLGTYIVDDKILSTDIRIEEIQIKDSLTVFDTVQYTRWGPLTYLDDTSHYLHNYAMHWVGHETKDADELRSFVQLNKAKNLDDYLDAASSFRSPAQNIVFASKTGDIALRVSGVIPIRGEQKGIFVQDGSTSANDWLGFVPAAENPLVINPDRGFVSSANQISTDSTYPYSYHGHFDDYRGRILNQKLAMMSDITPKDMMQLQNNDESLLAVDGLESLLYAIGDTHTLTPSATKYLNVLQNWDKRFRADQLAPAIFMNWFLDFSKMTWDEFNGVESKLKIPEYWRTLELAIDYPNHAFFDIKGTGILETSHDIAIMTLEKTCVRMDSFLEADSQFNWGKYNNNRITHLMSLPAFSSKVNPVNGVRYGLNAASATHGPSWRMVVELSDPVKAWGVYPGGQSGHPGNAHYDDMIDEWVHGEYFPLHLYANLAEAENLKGQVINFTMKQ